MASSGDVPGFGRAEVLQDDETNYKNLIMGINKQELIGKIHQIEGLSNDEKSALIELLKTHKKYGLVWEDKPEEVEERLRDELPVLTEVKERAPMGENLPDLCGVCIMVLSLFQVDLSLPLLFEVVLLVLLSFPCSYSFLLLIIRRLKNL